MAELGPFSLLGYDSFECEYYNIPPVHDTEEEAVAAAQAYWEQLQVAQPPETAGDLQDKLFIVDLAGNRRPFP